MVEKSVNLTLGHHKTFVGWIVHGGHPNQQLKF